MILLDINKIQGNINDTLLKKNIIFHVFKNIDSTNSFLKNLNNSDYLTVCCAEQQTNGRGRLGRSWYSPFGENIYLSLRWFINEHAGKFSPLSLTIGISIIQVLKLLDITKDIAIKWPNDIYYKDKKLAGTLIEITHHTQNSIMPIQGLASNSGCANTQSAEPQNSFNANSTESQKKSISVIAGLGININSDFKTQATNNWASLFDITQKNYDRNIIIALLITKIQKNFKILINHGFATFLELWHKYDYLYGKNITVTNLDNRIQGICSGINTLGELQLSCKNGEVISLKSGEATISKSN